MEVLKNLKYNFYLIGVTIVLYSGAKWSSDNNIWWVHTATSEVILVFAVLSIGGRSIVEKLRRKLPEFSTGVLLGYVSFSFLVALFLAFVYIVSRMYAGKVFAYNFFAVYFLYTTFDIYSLIANLRQISEDTLKDNKKSGEELQNNR